MKERSWDRLVRYWVRLAQQARSTKTRQLFWSMALQTAERSYGWTVFRWTHRTDDNHARLVEITRIGRSGALYGRAHYKTRSPGAVRWWGRTR